MLAVVGALPVSFTSIWYPAKIDYNGVGSGVGNRVRAYLDIKDGDGTLKNC